MHGTALDTVEDFPISWNLADCRAKIQTLESGQTSKLVTGWMTRRSSQGRCDENHNTACYSTMVYVLGFLFYEMGKRSVLTSVLQETKR